jgi:trimethylamine:corrinoid methyltransferase-like protein
MNSSAAMAIPAGRARRRRERQPSGNGGRIEAVGGRFAPMDADAVLAIEHAALDILASVGLSDASPRAAALVCAAGGSVDGAGRQLPWCSAAWPNFRAR